MEATRKGNSDSVAAGIAPVVDRVATTAHEAVDKAANAVNAAAKAVSKRTEQFTDLPAQYLDTCRSQVRDHPLTALGIAIAAGFLLSQILTRR